MIHTMPARSPASPTSSGTLLHPGAPRLAVARPLRVALAIVGLLAPGACASEDERLGPDGGADVSDSAGVRIVVNRIPERGLPEYATVAEAPSLELRDPGVEGASPFSDVIGVRSTREGTIAVADAGLGRVSFHTATGEPLGFGRLSQGRQRYRALTRLGVADEAFWTYDALADRLDGFDGVGVERTARGPGAGRVVGRFGDGSFLLVPDWTLALHRASPTEGVRRDTATWVRWWPDGGDTATLGRFPFNEVLVVETSSEEAFGLPPFGRGTSLAVGPGRFYVGDQETFEIRGHDPDGTLREIIRLEGFDQTLTPGVVEAARPRPDSGGPPLPPWTEAFWASVPERRPAYTRFLLDALGNLWVAEHVATAATPRNWIVFDAAGTVRGLVEMPPGFAPSEIGADYALGVSSAGGKGRAVRRYALVRGG